jgi:5-methylcytosine-specific restriction protein A
MPMAAPRPCSKAGCIKLASKKGRCDLHQVKSWDHKGKTRHERGYGTAWDKLRKSALDRDNHLCQKCLRKKVYTLATEVDHIKPKYKGGTDNLINLEGICSKCHKVKTQKESEDSRNGRHD